MAAPASPPLGLSSSHRPAEMVSNPVTVPLSGGVMRYNPFEVKVLPDAVSSGYLERDSPTDHLCIMCENEGLTTCSKCGIARYCSETCRQADWPMHEYICQDMAKFQDTRPPSGRHFRALIFPTHTKKPELTWVQYDSKAGTITIDHPDLDEVCQVLGRVPISERPFLCEYMPRELVEGYHTENVCGYVGIEHPHILDQPRFLNKAIAALGEPGFIFPRFGPLVHFSLAKGDGQLKRREKRSRQKKAARLRQKEKEKNEKKEKMEEGGEGEEDGFEQARAPDDEAVAEATPKAPVETIDQTMSPKKALAVQDQGSSKGTPTPEPTNATQARIVPDTNKPVLQVGEAVRAQVQEHGFRVVNMSMRDYRYIMMSLLYIPHNPCVPAPGESPYLLCPAVRIADLDENLNKAMGITESPKQVPVILENPIQESYAWTLAFLVGLPWYIREAPLPEMSDRPPWSGISTRFFGYLTHFVRSSDEADYQEYVARTTRCQISRFFIVTHFAGGDLSPHHVMGLDSYLGFCALVKKVPTKEAFQKYWVVFKAKGIKAGLADIENVISPYDINHEHRPSTHEETDMAMGRIFRKEQYWRLVLENGTLTERFFEVARLPDAADSAGLE